MACDVPARAPGETRCPASTGKPTDGPSGVPLVPDRPSGADEPPTSIRLPRGADDGPAGRW